MGTLQRYILRSYLVAFLIAGMVLTFVLSVGFLFKVFQFIMRGASGTLVAQYLFASMPEVLGFTIPLALLVAALLVFGRMSTDSEIAAMKACGVSFTAIMRGPMIVAVLCTAVGLYLQCYAMPRGHYVRRTVANRIAIDAGVQLVEPGRFIDEIDNLAVFCDRKVDRTDRDGRGYTTLYGLLAIDRREGFLREIRADSADMRAEGGDLFFELRDATVTPVAEGVPGVTSMSSFTYVCKNAVSRTAKYNKKPKDYDFAELSEAIDAAKASASEISSEASDKWIAKLRFLMSYRIVWALSSLCFVLVGVPMGCQSARKESSKGMVLGVAMGIAFFLFIMLSESLSDKPAALPWLIVWTPVLISIGAACYLIPKNQ